MLLKYRGEQITSKIEMKELSVYKDRDYNASWSNYHCNFYNGFHRMSMEPTMFICDEITRRMGILRDVKKMWKNLGLGTLGYNPEPLYPDFVRQFFSSIELHYKSDSNRIASEGKLTFLLNGVLYEMSIHELCTLFGFETKHEACSLPKFPCAFLLWAVIGPSDYYVSREAKLTLLRNPVLRVVAKYLGHLFLGKEETGAMTETDLLLIHYGLPLALRPTYAGIAEQPPPELSVNMGAVFAQLLFDRKYRALRPLHKKPLDESMGSLLTRIFKFHNIDFSKTACVDTIVKFDAKFFNSNMILHSGNIYRFTISDGTILRCKLPQPSITSLTSEENLRFMPSAEFLYTPPETATKRRRGSSSSAPAQRQREDDIIPEITVDHTSVPSMEYLLPEYTGEYDLAPPPLEGTQQQQFAWQADSQAKLMTMMQRIWGALAKIRCPPRPSCCRATQTSETAGVSEDIPDVAGQRDTDMADADDAADTSDERAEPERDARLPRRRRGPGQSRSCSSDDHQ